MLRGRYETTLDSKYRTSLPSRYREVVAPEDESRVIVTTALEPCLVVYPYAAWCEFERKVAGQPSFDPSVVHLKRLYIAGAVECSLDSHGRILLPEPLREHAALRRELMWCGMIDYAELWDKERWLDTFSAAQSQAGGLGRALADLGL